MTHGKCYLDKTENMINAQDLYNLIRLESAMCFLYALYELILNTLNSDTQQQMRNWCDAALMTFPAINIE